MQLDGLWTVLTLLALSSFTLGNPILNEPLAAPRVFISFKGRNLDVFLSPPTTTPLPPSLIG